MCSIGDDITEEGNGKFMENTDISAIKICNKCRQNKPNIVLRRKDGYCKSCFLNGTVHKFKAFLGKHRFIRKDDNVLVNYFFGHPITSLLHFIRTGIDVSTPKKLKFNPIVLYIERNFHSNINERRRILEQIDEDVRQFQMTVYFVSFVDYVVNSEINLKTDYKEVTITEGDANEISKINAKKVSVTTQKEIDKQFQHQLLIQCAKKLNCQHVFMCNLAIDVASQILTNVALGRGGHLEMDIGVCDTRDSRVNIIKPLRSFDVKELALYNFYNNISPLIVQQPKSDPYSSVQNLMTSFVQNLQVNFPATITTVVKTGDKLSMDKAMWKNEKCSLCLLPIESATAKLTSAEATDFSHWLSTQKPDYEVSPVDRYEEALAGFKQNEKKYCFTCSGISKYLIKNDTS